VLGPPITGFLVDATDGYFWAFVLAAAVTLLGVVAYGFIVGKVEAVPWPDGEARGT
jgi:ACS family D-galactonate transporter-like MFS transporter